MRPIPRKLRQKLALDEFMKKCCNCGVTQGIEWNHALIYQNQQINEDYSIVPLCKKCHRGNFGTIRKEIKDYCEFIAITRGLAELTKRYPKFDWKQRKQFLESKFIKL